MSERKERALTNAQIDYLFDFTYRKRVRYYDVQVEIVDHLASSIEKKWEEQPDLSFENVLGQVYDSFGIFGFAKLLQARERAIEKRGIWEIGRFFQSLLHPNRLWVPLGIFLGLYQLFLFFPESHFETYLLLTAFFAYLPIVILAFRFIWRTRTQKYKSFLILKMPMSMAAGVGFALYGALYSWINLLVMEMGYSHGLFLAVAGVLTLMLLYGYAAAIHLPRQAERLIQQQFPEFVD